MDVHHRSEHNRRQAEERPPTSRYPMLSYLAEKKDISSAVFHWSLMYLVMNTIAGDDVKARNAVYDDKQRIQLRMLEESVKMIPVFKAELVQELCSLVQNLAGNLERGSWWAVRQAEMQLFKRFVLEPSQRVGLDLEFVLEVLGQCRSFKRCSITGKLIFDHQTPVASKRRTRAPPATDLEMVLAANIWGNRRLPLRLCEPYGQPRALAQAMDAFMRRDGIRGHPCAKVLQKGS